MIHLQGSFSLPIAFLVSFFSYIYWRETASVVTYIKLPSTSTSFFEKIFRSKLMVKAQETSLTIFERLA